MPGEGALARLRETTHRGDALPARRARAYYDVAVCVLEGARFFEVLRARPALRARA